MSYLRLIITNVFLISIPGSIHMVSIYFGLHFNLGHPVVSPLVNKSSEIVIENLITAQWLCFTTVEYSTADYCEVHPLSYMTSGMYHIVQIPLVGKEKSLFLYPYRNSILHQFTNNVENRYPICLTNSCTYV